MNLSATINEQFLNPQRDDFAFWTLVKTYVGRTANKFVPQALLEELTQDSMFQIALSLDRFKADPAHNGTGFSRWICAIVFRRSGDIKRNLYGARETPISQFGSWRDGDVWKEANLSHFSPTLSDEAYESLLASEDWPDTLAATLGAIRSALPAHDVPLFDSLRASGQFKSSAQIAGIGEKTAANRAHSWAKLATNPGTRQPTTVGLPASSRPDERLAIACAMGDKAACVIRDSWRFSFPVVTLPAAQFDAMAERGWTVITD